MKNESARWDKMTNEELCVEFQQTRSDNLFEYFYKRNVGLIKVCFGNHVKKFGNNEIDNIEQHARIAMFRCMLHFNAEFGVKFSTLYPYYAKKEKMYHRKEIMSIELPLWVISNLEFFHTLQETHPEYWLNHISLDTRIDPDSEVTYKDIIPDKNKPLTEGIIQDEFNINLLTLSKSFVSPNKQNVS